MRKLLYRLLWRLIPIEPFVTIHAIRDYGDEIVSMISHRGDLWIGTRQGKLYVITQDVFP